MNEDRRVHAHYDGMEVVRYDRSGKWYLEPQDKSLPRQHVGVRQAAATARWGIEFANGSAQFGRLGGSVFDRILKGEA